MLPGRAGRSNFLSNNSHITYHRAFKSSPSANNNAVCHSRLLFKLLLAALHHLANTSTSIIPIWCLVTVCPLKADSAVNEIHLQKRSCLHNYGICSVGPYRVSPRCQHFYERAAEIVRVALWANLCSQLFYQGIIMTEQLKCQINTKENEGIYTNSNNCHVGSDWADLK